MHPMSPSRAMKLRLKLAASTSLASSWLQSLWSNTAFCLKSALSSNLSLASRQTKLPVLSSAKGLISTMEASLSWKSLYRLRRIWETSGILLRLNPGPGCNLLSSSLTQALHTVDGELDNGVGVAGGHLLDVDTALAAGNTAGPVHRPLVHEGDVELLPCVLALGHHHRVADPA